MSKKAETILERYKKGYVTDIQLEKYKDLGVISQGEYEEILETK